jgi:hypothetical protein
MIWGNIMSSHGTGHYTGPESIEALTADREKMWHSFTSATTWAVVLTVVILIGLAVCLL